MLDSNEIEKLSQQFRQMENDLGIENKDLDINKILSDAGIDFDFSKLEEEMLNPTFTKFKLGYRIIHPDAVEPKYNYVTDSGFDLHSVEEITISPFGRALVPTGLCFDIPKGHEIQVRSKSGLAINQGLFVLNSPGTVDAGYTGEVKVIIFNTNNTEVTIKKGMKVAQGVVCPITSSEWLNLIKVDDINEKDRNSNGFGSTGI
jgi:dUTP pyrophosphatase